MKPDSDSSAELPHPTNRNWVWRTLQLVMRMIFLVWLRYRARGLHHIPKQGGGLVLVNHQSFLDPMLVGVPLQRPISFVGRESLFHVPVIGWILRNTYVFPINRERASTESIRNAVRRMEHGFLVGVFPEGTRSEDGTMAPFKPGFLALLRRVKLPVYPVGVAGAYEAYPRKAVFLRFRKVRVVFGEPLLPEELEPYSGRGKEQELIDLLTERVAECLREAEEWRHS